MKTSTCYSYYVACIVSAMPTKMLGPCDPKWDEQTTFQTAFSALWFPVHISNAFLTNKTVSGLYSTFINKHHCYIQNVSKYIYKCFKCSKMFINIQSYKYLTVYGNVQTSLHGMPHKWYIMWSIRRGRLSYVDYIVIHLWCYSRILSSQLLTFTKYFNISNRSLVPTINNCGLMSLFKRKS